MIRERHSNSISTIRIGRYAQSEDYRRRSGKVKTLFDRIAEFTGVTVEDDVWEGETMKWYYIPLTTAETLLERYNRLRNAHTLF